jgi:hypothetical protein
MNSAIKLSNKAARQMKNQTLKRNQSLELNFNKNTSKNEMKRINSIKQKDSPLKNVDSLAYFPPTLNASFESINR